jgi:hypothetical protein
MSSELVPYGPARAGREVSRRRCQQGEAGESPDYRLHTLPRMHFSEEVREQLDALLTAAREHDPARAGFTDLMTGSLGALLTGQELRTRRERLSDWWEI